VVIWLVSAIYNVINSEGCFYKILFHKIVQLSRIDIKAGMSSRKIPFIMLIGIYNVQLKNFPSARSKGKVYSKVYKAHFRPQTVLYCTISWTTKKYSIKDFEWEVQSKKVYLNAYKHKCSISGSYSILGSYRTPVEHLC